KETTFDLIISDIRMPGTNGIEAISQIREYLKQDKKAQVPEIFITGYASEENYKQAIQLKVAEYIYKPFDMNELLDIIKRHLG
ncbi:MAG: DNA-binding response regulator, partial [Candidatus Omnitrophica bacterium CG02_land_8_20_14_3_00__42_8]